MTSTITDPVGASPHLEALHQSLVTLCYKLQRLTSTPEPETNALKTIQIMARAIATVLRSLRDIAAMRKALVKKNDQPNSARTLAPTAQSVPIGPASLDPVKALTRAERRRAAREAQKAERCLKKQTGISLVGGEDASDLTSVTKDLAKAQGLLAARKTELE